MNILKSRAIDVESLITHEVPFEDVKSAYALAEDADTSVKVVLTYGSQ
jgi:threonine dehydrogenase-like Zn-dependent dehydrogenase